MNNNFYTTKINSTITQSFSIQEFLSTNIIDKMRLSGLNCGCGLSLESGCLNSDAIQIIDQNNNNSEINKIVIINDLFFYLQHDATEKFPLPSNSFEWIFSEHFIEHIAIEEAVEWLKEMYRLLKPNGFVRLSTPDLSRYINGYIDPNHTFFLEHQQNLIDMGCKNPSNRPAWMLNQIFRFWGHQWLYDLDELKLVFQAAGFSLQSLQECSFRQGRNSTVANFDHEFRRDESLYIEIVK